ncbi:MAG TPA: MFS transporter [Xanthobacteraceae bacterium]|nr:MFS transporter [Xanthobacteraceae bacterium]
MNFSNANVPKEVRSPAQTEHHKSIVLFAMCIAVFIAQLDISVVTLALKQIGAGLDAGVSALQWVIDAYNLFYACFLLTAGILGDRFGRRAMFNAGIILFAVGSLICGFSPNAALLIVGRAVTGLGAAFVIPTSLAILSSAYLDHAERAHAIGIWASCNALAQLFGLTAGGFAVDYLGWRWIFLLVVPACVLGCFLALRFVTESYGGKERGLDIPGQILAVLALGGFAFGFIEAPLIGWLSWAVLFSLLIAAAATIIFARVEVNTKDALVPGFLFRRTRFPAALLIAIAMTFGMYATTFLTPLYLQNVLHDSAVVAGIEMLPMSVSFLIVGRASGKLAIRFGPRAVMAGGTAAMGAGLLILSAVSLDWSLAANVALVESGVLIAGVGLGLNAGPVVSAAVSAAPESYAGVASGIVNTARIVGATLGVAVLGAVYASKAGQTAADAAGIVEGFRLAMWGAAASELVGTVVALLFIRSDALRREG